VGCILAELLGGRPFFKGRDYVDQLNQILHFLGTPNEETLSRIGSQRVFPIRVSSAKTEAQEYVRNLPFMPKIPFNHIFPNANPQGTSLFFICWFSLSESAIRITLFGDILTVALDLLERLLGFDPAQRITVEEALEHPYLAIWHDPNDEPDAPSPFDFGFETVNDIATMKRISPILSPLTQPFVPSCATRAGLILEMIYDEVVRFRHLVRNQELPAPMDITTPAATTTTTTTTTQSGLQRSNSISQNTGGLPGAKGAQEAAQSYEKPPRPQETQVYEDGGDEMGDVERELATGLDGH